MLKAVNRAKMFALVYYYKRTTFFAAYRKSLVLKTNLNNKKQVHKKTHTKTYVWTSAYLFERSSKISSTRLVNDAFTSSNSGGLAGYTFNKIHYQFWSSVTDPAQRGSTPSCKCFGRHGKWITALRSVARVEESQTALQPVKGSSPRSDQHSGS